VVSLPAPYDMAMLRTFAKDVMPALPGSGTVTAGAGATDGTEEREPDPEGEVDASTGETWGREQR